MLSSRPVFLLSNDGHVLNHWALLDTTRWTTQKIHQRTQLPTEPVLVVIDVDMIDWSDVEWHQVMQRHLVLVASCYPNDTQGQQAIVEGAKAYIHAYSSLELLEQALLQVQRGQIWVGESLLNRLLSQIGRKLPRQYIWQQHLTAREMDIAERAALGHSNQLIANDLGISERTVRAHLSSVFEKLGVKDRLKLALKVHGVL